MSGDKLFAIIGFQNTDHRLQKLYPFLYHSLILYRQVFLIKDLILKL